MGNIVEMPILSYTLKVRISKEKERFGKLKGEYENKWHSRGRGFDPHQLHHKQGHLNVS